MDFDQVTVNEVNSNYYTFTRSVYGALSISRLAVLLNYSLHKSKHKKRDTNPHKQSLLCIVNAS